MRGAGWSKVKPSMSWLPVRRGCRNATLAHKVLTVLGSARTGRNAQAMGRVPYLWARYVWLVWPLRAGWRGRSGNGQAAARAKVPRGAPHAPHRTHAPPARPTPWRREAMAIAGVGGRARVGAACARRDLKSGASGDIETTKRSDQTRLGEKITNIRKI